MPSLKDLRKRVATVRSTQQITKAMKMVAAAKLRRAEEAAERARPYADRVTSLLTTLVAGDDTPAHPLLVPREEKSRVVILVTADRGLCGAYNTNLARCAEAFLAKCEGETRLNVLGRRGAEYFRRRRVSIEKTLPGPLAASPGDTARSLASALTARVSDGDTDAVYLVYSHFKSVLSQVPTVTRLLPVPIPEAAGASHDYLYEPDAASALAEIVPRYVTAQLTRALLEAAASEHGARMTAMDSATRNASELIERLTLQMNRARQAAITKELMEIVGGAEALKG